ncbi:uncharacterized protein LOC128887609 isoform X1 [Hylaeus anthracinus]|uniref:uncharacterized protein LOC128887609 isoform X1 n=2 Tax=Hylaeus anthracinus TaxID=313031 RepID=UPI0023B9D943|nr:uncharacterized protein LOC128887609 isoform X1 [Hylaeus anthracinus]
MSIIPWVKHAFHRTGILVDMKTSPICWLVASLFLPCFVSPLQSEPQKVYWPSYSLYDPSDPRLQPAEILSYRYSAPMVQRPPSYATRYESKSFPAYAVNYFENRQSTYSARVPEETLHAERYYDYHDFVANNQERGESSDRAHLGQAKDAETSSKEKEIIKNMSILDKLLSEDSNEKDLGNTIQDNIISEETKRVAREIRKQKPGFFWTLARITFETINDTKSAIQQIGEIVNNSIVPDSATQSSMMSGSLTAINTNATANKTADLNGTETTTTTSPTTTTETTVLLTRSDLQSLIRRNVLGLVRLFNIEWKDALNESETTVREFRKNLGNQVDSFLQDNPNAYRGV